MRISLAVLCLFTVLALYAVSTTARRFRDDAGQYAPNEDDIVGEGMKESGGRNKSQLAKKIFTDLIGSLGETSQEESQSLKDQIVNQIAKAITNSIVSKLFASSQNWKINAFRLNQYDNE